MQPMLWVVLGSIALAVGVVMIIIASTQSDPTAGIASFISIPVGLFGILKPILDWLRKPALEFGIVTATKNSTVDYGSMAAFYALSLRLQVEKVRGSGKAEQCEAFLTIDNSRIRNIALRWLPDNVRYYDIGGSMDLLLFQLVPQVASEVIIFSAISTQNQISTIELPFKDFQSQRLKIEIHSTNAKNPIRYEKMVNEILDAIVLPS